MCQGLPEEIFFFRFPEIYGSLPAVPFPIRGALRDRHERWKRDAMDALARETSAPMRSAKPCGPGAPTLASTSGSKARGDGGYQARHPGESAEQPLTPSRREGRTVSAYLW